MSGDADAAAGDWLSARSAGVPSALRERMASAVAELAGGPTSTATAAASHATGEAASTPERAAVPDVLADTALACLRAALALGDSRTAAMELLAADGLLTYACEAAVEMGADADDWLARELSPDRFAAMLPEDG